MHVSVTSVTAVDMSLLQICQTRMYLYLPAKWPHSHLHSGVITLAHLVNCNFCVERPVAAWNMALRALTAGSRTGRCQAVGSLTFRSLFGVRGFASAEQQVRQVCAAHTGLQVKHKSHMWLVDAGLGGSGRRPGRLCLCDQSSPDGDEGHLYRGSRKARRYLSQHWMHPFKGSRSFKL